MDLSASSLSCRRGGRLVFEAVSLSAPAGAAVRLTGPNGAGKSSLLRVLAGLLPPAAGEARLGDTGLDDHEAWRERVAYAGHLDAVKPAFSVIENLRAWAAILGGDPREAGPALERFGVSAIADDPAILCSAGQKRRLGLARLLVAPRPLWLLDEPTVSLDAEGARAVSAAVAEHCAGGGVAIAATHVGIDLPEGPELALPARASAAEPAASDPFLGAGWT